MEKNKPTNTRHGKTKRNLPFFFILICNSFLFAQVPTISYSGVQSSYTISTTMSPLTPTNSGGLTVDRTNVSTIAGNGAGGYADGTIASPKYNGPSGIAVAASGNIYIVDKQNHCIRKITPTGYVSTFAGTGSAGFANGSGDVAQFDTPYSIAVDASENLYLTEFNSDAIRKITSAGVVSTFAGNVSTAGFLDGQSNVALFSNPKGLCVDGSGNVYVADSANNRIRKISSTGIVSTVAGDGTAGYLDAQGTSAKFSNPTYVAVSASGTIYVSDTSNNRIRSISVTGLVTTFAGSTTGMVNGQGTAAQFNAPRALDVDASGNLCVIDYNNNRIRKITSTGLVSTLSGTGGYGASNGPGTASSFKYPEGIAFDSSGNAFVADVSNNCIRKITSAGDTTTYSGSATSGLENGYSGTIAMFSNPVAVSVVSSGIVYAIDDYNSCIRKITTDGLVSTFAGNSATGYADGTGTAAYFNNPKGMAVDASGNIYVADTFNNRIRKITSSGVVTTIAGDGTAGFSDGQGTAARFNNPFGLTIDSAGNIYVADTKNYRIRKISASGLVTTVTGDSFPGFADGAPNVAMFKDPKGIVVDNATGILYVADTGNNRIRKIVSGTASTLAGTTIGFADGQGVLAQFYNPIGITIDGSGDIFVGDYYNSRIRKITNTGLVTTYAGSGYTDFADGIGNVAAFYLPVGLAADTSGTIYVADSYTQRIRKITSVDPYSISPALPTGISFNTSTGVISGTPTQTTTATTYTIGASNYTGTGTTTITFATGTSTGPAAPTASAQSFCNLATVANLVATGTALKWYNVATGGTALASTTALATGTYYVSQTVSSIESSRTSVAVTINITTAPTATAQSFCTAATVSNLVATGTSLKWYNVSTGGTVLASTTALSSGTYYVSQTLNSCESARTSVSVTINTTAAPTANAQSFCTSATVSNLVATGTSLKWYNVSTGGTALASTTALSSGTYYVSQTLNSCESPRASVSVTINTTVAPTANAQSFCTSATVSNLVATGTSLKWYNVSTGGTALASTTALATGTYYVSQTLNSCESPRASVSVTINTTVAPTASVQTFSSGATVSNLVATGTSLQWYTTSTGGTALASTTALSSGTYYVSQTLNSCESTRTSVSVTINTAPGAPTASAQSFCNSATVANLVATGTTLQWYSVSTGGTALALTTALVTGTYYVSQTVSTIESSRTSVAVTINTTIAPTANAQSFCTSATVANLVATGTSLKWYNVSTGGTVLASTTALATGNYYVSQTLNSCESARTSVAVTINTTTAPTASAQSFCTSATVSNLVATGTSLKWYNVSTGGTALASTTALSSGTYYVSQTLNSCESTRTSVGVTINTTAAPTASAQSFCTSATVSNLVATGTSLKWYNVSTGGTALASTTALSTGTYYVSQTLNSCESTRTSVAVTINTTAAPTASAQTFANSATVANLIATGTSLQWYNVSTGGTALASITALSTGTYYVSQTLNSCESIRTSVSVTINTAPGAPTASAQTFCNSATIANLVATGSSLQWYTALTGGTALASTTTLTTGNYYVSQTVSSIESARTSVSVTINTTIAPTASAQSFCTSTIVSNLVATGTSLQWYNVSTGGTALASTTALSSGTYYVSQTLNSCESARTGVAVTINTTAAPTASAQTFNNSATVANLVATGTSLQWYSVSSGGTALTSTTALSSGTYYVSQTLNSCESTRTSVSVTINTAPGAPTASAQTFCNAATVSNLVATGTALKWYNVATGGTALLSTAALGTGNYYVSQTVSSIESARTTVFVTVNITALPTASSQGFCTSATVANLVATGTSLKWYSVASGGTALTSTVSLSTGNYYVSQTLNSCESSRTLVAVTINPAPTAPTASAQTFCATATVANLTAAGTSLKWYSALTGGTPLASTTVLITGNYYVSQTLNFCESSRATVAVTINSTIAPTATAQTFCTSATVANLTANGTSLKWYSVSTGGTPLASTTVLITGNYYVSQTLNFCESSRATVAVTINSTIAPTATAQTFCTSATVANLTANGTSLKWYSVSTGGTPLASTTVLISGNYYVSQTLNSCESSRTTVAVTIDATVTPTATAQAFCTSATVANLTATGSSLQWYNVATGGTALASTTALSTGTYYVSQTVNSCESARISVSVTINTTAAPTASSQTFNNSATVANLIATGTALQWYANSTGGTALALTTVLVSVNYYVSQTLNGCESARTLVAVTINGVPPAPTASAQAFCTGATVANLVAIGTSLKWYNVATGGTALTSTTVLTSGNYYVSQTISSIESPRTTVTVTLSATSTPTVSSQTFCNSATVANLVATGTAIQWYTVATGGTPLVSTTALVTGVYYVSQTVNGCESSRILIGVTINNTASPTATAQTFCTSATVASLTATGTSLKWYTASSGGTALASTVALTTGNYYVSQALNGCESTRTVVAVTINTTAAPTASAQTYSVGATVANLTATGTSLKWYTVATGGTPLATTTALTTGNYYVSQTLNGCESLRTLVFITINTGTSAPTASAQSFCTASTVSNLTATGTSLKWYTTATGGTALASTATLVTGNYYVSQTIGSIESPRTLVSITVYGVPIAKSINSTTSSGSARSPICTSDTKVLNVKSGYSATTIQWERAVVALNSNTAPNSSAYSTILGATGPSFTVTNATAGKNYYRAKFINGNCDNTAVYSSAAIVYYKECAANKLNAVISFPNPYSDNFSINLSTTSEEKVGVSVFDMTGRLIEQREVNLIDVPELKIGERYPSGIYNVLVTQGDEVKTTRVIKR